MTTNRLDLLKQGYWIDGCNNTKPLSKLALTHLYNILAFCNLEQAEYIWLEIDYRQNPTEKWVRQLFRA